MRDLLNQLISAWNEHDLDHLVMLYAADYEGQDVGLAQTYCGWAGIRQTAQYYYTAFPDLSFTSTEVLIDGDHAALFWVSYGTHHGKIMNIPPTGRSVKVNGVTTLTIRNGLVTRSAVLWDVAGLLREIGLLPDL